MTITNESPGYLPVDFGMKPSPEGLLSLESEVNSSTSPFQVFIFYELARI